MKLLSEIQKNLKAPKSQFNGFGKYHYRNCEDILEALKPLLSEDDVFYISDSIEQIGDRYYVKATALFNGISVSAYARESLDKKGMDDSQITGATSSYARKYALNGLFAIDDTKDADAGVVSTDIGKSVSDNTKTDNTNNTLKEQVDAKIATFTESSQFTKMFEYFKTSNPELATYVDVRHAEFLEANSKFDLVQPV